MKCKKCGKHLAVPFSRPKRDYRMCINYHCDNNNVKIYLD